jgi:ribosomal protein S20
MLKTKKRRILTIIGALALTLVVTGASLLVRTSVARASEMTAEDLRTITQASTGPGLFGEGYLSHGGWGKGEIDYQALLAEALGITVEELQTANQAARDAAIAQALEQGLITQEQADNLTVWGDRGGFRFPSFKRAPKDVNADVEGIDENALLAEALGITVEKLQTAREQANEAAIAQAIEKGIITQEQADQMQSRKDLMSYLDQNTLLAKGLGISVEELQAAREEGKTLTDLLADSGLDAVTLRTKIQEATEAAIAQAVKDGVITQEQADQMKDRPSLGFGAPGRGMMDRMPFGNREGGQMPFGDRDGGRQRPCPPSSDTDDTSGTYWHHPGRVIQEDSTL